MMVNVVLGGGWSRLTGPSFGLLFSGDGSGSGRLSSGESEFMGSKNEVQGSEAELELSATLPRDFVVGATLIVRLRIGLKNTLSKELPRFAPWRETIRSAVNDSSGRQPAAILSQIC